MPAGMTPVAPGDMGMRTAATQDRNGWLQSIHNFPVEQFVHELDFEVTCVCGPDVAYMHFPHAVVPFVTHKALDPRYYWDDEDYEDDEDLPPLSYH